MCDINVKNEFEKKLKENNIFDEFKKYFGENWYTEQINANGWNLYPKKIVFFSDPNSNEIQNIDKVDGLKKVLKKMGFKYHYKNSYFALFLKEKMVNSL